MCQSVMHEADSVGKQEGHETVTSVSVDALDTYWGEISALHEASR